MFREANLWFTFLKYYFQEIMFFKLIFGQFLPIPIKEICENPTLIYKKKLIKKVSCYSY